MAAVKAMRGTKLLLKIGNGAGPEVFTAMCSINAARGIQFSASTNEQNVPDCADPDLMAWASREKVALSASINGAGMVNTPDLTDLFDWFSSADTKNCQLHLADVVLADGGGYWAGALHLTDFQVTGDRGAKAEVSITLQSDGAITWTDAAA